MEDKNSLTKPGAPPPAAGLGTAGLSRPCQAAERAVLSKERETLRFWLISASSRLQVALY